MTEPNGPCIYCGAPAFTLLSTLECANGCPVRKPPPPEPKYETAEIWGEGRFSDERGYTARLVGAFSWGPWAPLPELAIAALIERDATRLRTTEAETPSWLAHVPKDYRASMQAALEYVAKSWIAEVPDPGKHGYPKKWKIEKTPNLYWLVYVDGLRQGHFYTLEEAFKKLAQELWPPKSNIEYGTALHRAVESFDSLGHVPSEFRERIRLHAVNVVDECVGSVAEGYPVNWKIFRVNQRWNVYVDDNSKYTRIATRVSVADAFLALSHRLWPAF